jgi:hypothetical protein
MPGLIRGVARTAAVVGTASAVNGRVQHRQQSKYAAQDQQAADAAAYQQQQYAPPPEQQYAPPPPAAPAAPAVDPIEQLTKLGELHTAGVLTDEEFAVQKNKILNG